MYAIYILNRTPTRALDKDITPIEAYTSNKPSVAHIRPFGCKAFVHVPDEKRQKLDLKSLECVLVGMLRASERIACFTAPLAASTSRATSFSMKGHDVEPPRITISIEPFVALSTAPSRYRTTVEEVEDEGEPPRSAPPEDEPSEEASEDVEQAEDSSVHENEDVSEPPPPAPSRPVRTQWSIPIAPGAPYPSPIPSADVRCSVRTRRMPVPHDDARYRVSSYNRRAGRTVPQAASTEEPADEQDAAEAVGDEHAHRALAVDGELPTYEEAMSRPDADMWKAACAEELFAFAKAEQCDKTRLLSLDTIEPSGTCLILKTHLQPTTLRPLGFSTSS